MSKKQTPKKAQSKTTSSKQSAKKESPAKVPNMDKSKTLAPYRKHHTSSKDKTYISTSLISFVLLKYCESCQSVYFAIKHCCLAHHIIIPASGNIVAFDIYTKSLKQLPIEAFVLEYFNRSNFISFKNKIYINGERSMHSYNLDSGVHAKLKEKLARKTRSALTKDESKIYTFGGSSIAFEQTSCEVYDVRLNTWEHFPNCVRERSGHAACKNGNCFYVTGGIHIQQAPNTFEKYNPGLKKWTELKVIQSIRCGYDSVMISVSRDMILMFSMDDYETSGACYEINTKSGKFDPIFKEDILSDGIGYNYPYVLVKNELYAIATSEHYIHYDTQTRVLETIPYNLNVKETGIKIKEKGDMIYAVY